MTFKRKRKMKWIFSSKFINCEWAERDLKALYLDPEIKLLKHQTVPVYAEGQQTYYMTLYWVESTCEKYDRVRETLKETHKEDFYLGYPILKCALNVERSLENA